MAVRQDTIWERFLSPVARFFIDEDGLRRYQQSIDWEKESDRYRRADVIIPSYYSSQNFHGIKGGYLTSDAAVTYDPITQYVLPPSESVVRQALIDAVKVKPRRILDLGCGTGSTTLMLKQAFPEAEVIGLDLSPYMLVRAEDKSRTAGLDIVWRHGNAEKTGFSDASFDLVTASLLFHEIPDTVSLAILRESFRLLVTGGQVLIQDGNQKTLRQLEWLNDLFEEPYIREYANGSVEANMGAAGFEAVRTQDVWWINQVTSGIKPIASENIRQYSATSIGTTIDNNNLEELGSPAFGIIA
ncbi:MULTISPECIES: class I SAM-dependent methyltransferase [Nostoc]|uniref:Class I SAM-dependent methyltransferase n=1 Tax=Nostoc paludosum FACHB-159 TaxID=2692908 RepID=A0ABR8KA88_9NOSO|nr:MULTISPECIES: class I SAM-dependent methyltransferase [Nostoc]MBD2679503.1 class I SAM-dependent methyltransferase [Nostoc sp. FACHB-857]MBD2735761.1 class I SAM-dependent methyltransferase [Nostoc paludosum FACHB-159]